MYFKLKRESRVLRTPLVLVAGLAALLAAAPPALAAPFRVAIPQLVGPIAFPHHGVPFDFEQEFAHVESVSLELVAAATALEYEHCGLIFAPQPCVHHTVQPGILAILNDDPFPGVAFTTIGENSLSESASLHSGQFEAPFISSFDFEWLRSGRGSFDIHWNALGFFPEEVINFTAFRTGTIDEAYIVFDATPVPEPSCALLVASGLALLARRSRVGNLGPRTSLRRGMAKYTPSA